MDNINKAHKTYLNLKEKTKQARDKWLILMGLKQIKAIKSYEMDLHEMYKKIKKENE